MNFFQKVQNTKNTLKGFKVNNMNKIDYKNNYVGEKVETLHIQEARFLVRVLLRIAHPPPYPAHNRINVSSF